MITNFIKGIIIGIGKIIPGVSGSMLAISFGVYEKALDIIANFCKLTIEKFFFLLTLILGILIGTIIFSRCVKYMLEIFYLPTMLLFIGLILGGIPEIINKIKNEKRNFFDIFIFTFALTLSYILTIIGKAEFIIHENIFIYFLIGVIEAFSSVVPGISGTAIFMSLGVYRLILDFFSNIFNPNYFVFGIFFSLGILVGIICLAKLITYFLIKCKKKFYITILGFMTSSLILMIQATLKTHIDIYNILIGIFLLILGFNITIKINKILAND